MFLVDFEQGRLIPDEELKDEFASRRPYGEWLREQRIELSDLRPGKEPHGFDPETLLPRMQAFGYTIETMQFMLLPLVTQKRDPVGSMGNDSALACLSDQPRMLYDYFKQLFAQVTNPAIDSIREEIIMSLECYIGPEGNLLETTDRALPPAAGPASDPDQRGAGGDQAHGPSRLADEDDRHHVSRGSEGDRRVLAALWIGSARKRRRRSTKATAWSCCPIATIGAERVPVSALLACGAVHHHLVRQAKRTRIGHRAGNRRGPRGASSLPAGRLRRRCHQSLPGLRSAVAGPTRRAAGPTGVRHGREDRGRLPQGRRQGHAQGDGQDGHLHAAVLQGGPDLRGRWAERRGDRSLLRRHGQPRAGVEFRRAGRGTAAPARLGLSATRSRTTRRRCPTRASSTGEPSGERHMWDPQAIAEPAGRRAARTTARPTGDSPNTPITTPQRAARLRGLLQFREAPTAVRFRLDEVEPASEIVKRFCTGAMSFGSISAEAHETLAIAMNRLGGKSNTGEGGEDPERFKPLPNGDSERSAIKQVASGRFGVTIWYLTNADELQIKIAQGAKPGEGGELPGRKVDENIARIRYSTPGVGLISPPPHHDIYSIEDLAQLIHDLKNANPAARISVKLVSEVGVGTIAAGVAKAHADHILISGDAGGTGASPLTSIKHAGLPWELGIAETHQTLVLNDLRSRVVLQTDGGLKTGRDVVIAALLGAEEMGFSTAPADHAGLHHDAQVPSEHLPGRHRHAGPGAAQEVRRASRNTWSTTCSWWPKKRGEIMAQLGFRTIDEMIGRVDVLETDEAIATGRPTAWT